MGLGRRFFVAFQESTEKVHEGDEDIVRGECDNRVGAGHTGRHSPFTFSAPNVVTAPPSEQGQARISSSRCEEKNGSHAEDSTKEKYSSPGDFFLKT